jgi:predicted DNA-binding mobile mystery protein A
MPNKASLRLRREQLDRALTQPAALKNLALPKRGWIREMRDALGLSARQLAARMGVSQPTVAKMEQSEARGSLTLASLQKAAEAMDCRLTYAFAPRTSLEDIVHARAAAAATRLLSRVEHTMVLEAQGADGEFRARRIQELTNELVRTLSRELWEEDTNEARLS